VNGTLACLASAGGDAVAEYCAALAHDPRFADVDWKTSTSSVPPFPDLSVRVAKEIVGYGRALAGVDPRNGGAGTHLAPEAFHAAVAAAAADPRQDTVLLDVRNAFEHAIGRFDGAQDLGMRVTSDFAPWVQAHAASLAGKRVLMYCTGGVRCEKASAFLKASVPGVGDVSQLSGGIHRYLEAFPSGGLFRGKNFVFDARVTVAPPLAAAAAAAAAAAPSSGGSSLKRLRASGEAAAADDGDDAESPGAGPAATAEARDAGPVVGACGSCGAAHDGGPRATDVCAVCRAVCLACDRCRRRDAELHCRAHRRLAGAYYWFLGPFDAAELAAQQAALEALVAVPKGSQQPGGWVGGSKRRGQTVRKQLGRVAARLRELQAHQDEATGDALGEAGAAAAAEGTLAWALAPGPHHPRRCRWCFHVLEQQVTARASDAAAAVARANGGDSGRSAAAGGASGPACNGRCWGFWKAPAGARGEVEA
jgi:predicted sulfurtransferase